MTRSIRQDHAQAVFALCMKTLTGTTRAKGPWRTFPMRREATRSGLGAEMVGRNVE